MDKRVSAHQRCAETYYFNNKNLSDYLVVKVQIKALSLLALKMVA